MRTQGWRRITPFAVLLGSGILVIVAAWLPWASRTNRATEVTTEFRSGAVGFVLVALAIAAIACSVRGVVATSMRLQSLACVLSAACFVTALVLALTRIKAANDAAVSSVGVGNRTSYEVGAVLGVLGSAALLTSCFVLRGHSRRSDSAVLGTIPNEGSVSA